MELLGKLREAGLQEEQLEKVEIDVRERSVIARLTAPGEGLGNFMNIESHKLGVMGCCPRPLERLAQNDPVLLALPREHEHSEASSPLPGGVGEIEKQSPKIAVKITF